MRFGTVVVAIVILVSTAMPVTAWSHGGRGGPAPRAPHYNPPRPPHISQPAQPHYNQPKAPRSNGSSSGSHQQAVQQYGYRSRAKSNQSTNSNLAHSNSGASGTHVKPKLNTGQVGSTRSQGKTTVNSVAQTNATGTTAITANGSGRAMLPYLFNGTGATSYGYHPHRSYRSSYGYGYGNRGYRNSNYFGQMRALSRLVNDLNRLSIGTVVNTGHGNRIRNDLMGVVSGTGRPPMQAVQQLSTALVNALPGRSTPMMNTGQLARDLAVVMNGNGMNMMQIQHSIGNAQSVMRSSGVPQAGVQSVTQGLRMVASWGNPASPLAQLR